MSQAKTGNSNLEERGIKMKKGFMKKLASFVLAVVMVMTAMPFSAINVFAAETIKGEVETVYREGSSSSRETRLDQGWKFSMNSTDCSAITYNDSSWQSISLPHDFSITQAYTTSGEGESGFLPGGTGWYRKKLVLPVEQQGKRFELNFDGSYMHTYVYVNGDYVGENHYGYNSFAFDITDKLICDGATENIIAVKVVHNLPSSRWYSGSGLYRPVTLITTDPVHIAHNGLTVTTPNISSGNGTVNAVAKVQNQSTSSSTVTVKASIFEKGSENAVATATQNATVNAGATSNVTVTPVVSNPKLWNIDNPNLYTAVIEIIKDGAVIDTYEDSFGFRYFEWSRTNGFYLNGTRVQLQGVCMHHDQGALGSAAYYDAMYRQMENMKEMGVNAIRATHNPYSEEFYKICDELGLLVIEELFDGWAWAKNGNTNDFSSQWNVSLTSNNTIIGGNSSMTWPEFVTKEVCQRDVNRASVFLWSLCNELTEGSSVSVSSTDAANICTNLINWIRTVDNTRKVTSGDNNLRYSASPYISYENVLTNNGGVVGLNYAKASEYSTLYNRYNYTYYGSETSSSTNTRAMYKGIASNTSVDGRRHLTAYDTSAVGWGVTACDSMLNIYQVPYSAGEFIWTGWDYIGEPTPWNGTSSGEYESGSGATPNSSYFGIVDTAGFEKDTYYLYRSHWNDKEDDVTTHLVTAWDSDNYYVSNGKTPVFVYSNAYKVEVYLRKNGSSTDTLMGTATRNDVQNSIGTKYFQYNATSNNSSECTATSLSSGSGTSMYARFDIAYTDGTLFTKSYDKNGNLIDNNNITGRHTVTTAGDVSKMEFTANKKEITADGQSLAYFSVDLLDNNGNPVTTGENEITFNITGDGEIMGVDNGDEATTAKFQQSSVIDINNRTTAKIKAWGGKALVIVRSTKNAGSFTVTASASGLSSKSATVNTTALDENTELQDGEIDSYSLVRNYTVKVGSRPTFDNKVTATVVGSDQELTGTITWDEVPSSIYTVAGDYIISGVANFDGYTPILVTCTLHVIDSIAAARNVSAQTMTNTVPKLPEYVVGLSADGNDSGQFEVEWETMRASQFSKVGEIVEVNGTVTYFDNEQVGVKAFVRVVEPNVETNSNITNTAIISSDVTDGDLSALRDGNLTTKAWTNESNATKSDKAYIQYQWATVVLLSSIDIAYNIGGKAVQPEDVDIQISTNAVDYKSVGYTASLETKTGGKYYRYTLDETLNPIAVRIVFTQQMRTTGDYCVAVNDVKLNTEIKTLPDANDSADLTSISVDGEKISGFSANKLNYNNVVLTEESVVTATGKDNAAVTVLPYKDGNVKVITLAEDGSDSKTYIIGKVSTPVEYVNIAPKATVTSNATNGSLSILTDGNKAYNKDNNAVYNWNVRSEGQMTVTFTWDKAYDLSYTNINFFSEGWGTFPPKQLDIYASTDGSTFGNTPIMSYTNDGTNIPSVTSSANVYEKKYDFPANTKAKAIKIVATVRDGSISSGKFATGYAEIEIFGAEYVDTDAPEEEVLYTFNGANATYTSGNSPYLFTDSTNGTYISGCQWGTTGAYNSNGYIQVDNGTLTSVKASDKKSSGDTISGVNGDNWAISMKYQYNNNDNAAVTLFGIGSHDSVTTQSGGQTTDSGYMTNGRFGADLIQVYKNGDVYVNGSSTGETISGVQSSSAQTITFKYESGTIKVLIDGAEKASIDVSSYKDKFEAGPGNWFIGTSAANLAGGTWHYYGKTNTGYAIYSFKLYEINAIKYTSKEVEPENPEEPEGTEYVADTTAIDSAMRAFETKVASGKIYKNIYNAYSAYVECQKARDAAKYGKDSSIDLAAKAQALTTKTNALTEWTMSMPTDISKVSARFSSYDNATSNKQYFKSALFITQSDDPVVVNNNPGHAWFGVYYHNGTYIYDGTNAIEVPVMLMTIPYKNPFYFFSAYLSGQNSAVSLKGRWFGSDGPGSGQARKYYYYHDEASLQSMSSDYYSRRFSFPSTSSYNNNSTFNDSKIGDLSGKSNWNLATTNTFVINGATLFPSGSKTVSTDVSMGTINMHTYNSTSLSSPWKNSYTLGTQVKVINQKGLKDRVTTYTNKLKDVASYKEGGLNWGTYGIETFAGLNYNITAQAAGTLTNDMTTAHTQFNSADSATATDSTAYAALRTALDGATKLVNDDCYDDTKFEAYITARNNAINAMKSVATSGYSTNSTNISALATALNSAKTAMLLSSGEHKYGAGVYNEAANKIIYTCKTNAEHTLELSTETYSAAVAELNATLAQTEKFKEQSIKNCLAEITENGYFDIINGDKVEKILTTTQLDTITTAIATLNTTLNERINIKRFDIDYTYQKNEEVVSSGMVVDARYGDWLHNSAYTLGENEQVVKWTVQDENGTERTSNLSLNFNILATKNMSLACYISDGTEGSADNQYKVTFENRFNRVQGIEYVAKDATLTVDADTVKDSEGNVLYRANKLPYYQVKGFKVGSTTYQTGDVITFTRDTVIKPVYVEDGNVNIYTSGAAAAEVTINGEKNSYQGKWDEEIVLEANAKGLSVYWYINDKLVGYGTTYTFRATSNSKITVSQTAPTTNEPTVSTNYFNYDVELNKVTAVVSFYSAGQEAQSTGVILSTVYSSKDDIIAKGKKFGTTNFAGDNNQARISVSRTAGSSFTMYAVPFVTVNGVDYYGDVVSTSYTA